MKSLLFTTLVLATVTGCSGAIRSPDMYRNDTKAALDTKTHDILACYDGVLHTTPGVGGKVTVTFDVETEKGNFVNMKLDPANTTAPQAVSDCVTTSLTGLSIKPPDGNTGKASFEWDFNAPAAPTAAPKS